MTKLGIQHEKKSFMVGGDGGGLEINIKASGSEETDRLRKEESDRINQQVKAEQESARKKVKRVIPYGNRILVRRRRIGEKIGSVIIAAQETAERPTDLADVVYVPNHTFADKELIENSQAIITGLKDKAINGDSAALKALLDFHAYLRIKAIRPGSTVFISKYIGTDFHDNEGSGMLTIVNAEDIIGIVEQDNKE